MADRTIQIDLSSPTPAYRQVVDGIRSLLVAKAFAPGAKLPTVRRLAIDLNVHHNTVALAYRELAEEGWLELSRGRGATVVDRVKPPDPGRVAHAGWQQRLSELVAQGVAAGLPATAVAEALRAAARSVRK